jgi:hypothetical protein
MSDGSPGSREAEGEGDEGFYIGRRPDLLVPFSADTATSRDDPQPKAFPTF